MRGQSLKDYTNAKDICKYIKLITINLAKYKCVHCCKEFNNSGG